jgi:hypothetical protein
MLCSFKAQDIYVTVVVNSQIRSICRNNDSLNITYTDNTGSRYYFSNIEERNNAYSRLVDTLIEYYRLHNME